MKHCVQQSFTNKTGLVVLLFGIEFATKDDYILNIDMLPDKIRCFPREIKEKSKQKKLILILFSGSFKKSKIFRI